MRFHLLIIMILLLSAITSAQMPGPDLQITHLKGDFYVFTTYNFYKNTRIPANGLYLVTRDGVVMIDSPWDTTRFQPLLDSIQHRHNKKVVLCIATHFHEDRTGGLEFYRKQGIRTFTTRMTDLLSAQKSMKRAEFLIEKDTVISVGGYTIQTYYPGPGHAPDNIVVWFEREKILYGGCLVKSVEDSTLGNLGDADVKAYANTVRNVQQKFPKPAFVIPGHNAWTDTRALNHTLRMAEKLNQ